MCHNSNYFVEVPKTKQAFELQYNYDLIVFSLKEQLCFAINKDLIFNV